MIIFPITFRATFRNTNHVLECFPSSGAFGPNVALHPISATSEVPQAERELLS